MNGEPERNPARASAVPPASTAGTTMTGTTMAGTSTAGGVHDRAAVLVAHNERLQRERERDHDDDRGMAPGTAVALGLGALALGAIAYSALAPRRDADRPLDDAEPRLRHDGAWDGKYAVAGKSVLVNRPREEVYAFYRDLSNQPKFMANVREVRGDSERSTWVMSGLAGGDIEVEVEGVEDRPGERLAWRSVEGAPIDMHGHAEFRDAPAGRGTYVVLEMEYRPPLGAVGRLAATFTRESAQTHLRHGMKRLKMLLETGEVATSASRKEAR